ncbi:S41 family peptidase [Acetobacteraceae bacterium KSS8]|uniref:Tricorn protease homolog n=1 Tax=Endosaccharibacter trunci TaxID=2812733 RepID=A0ABT1W3I8_9PROT|nr:S41 family peptidase [Acetobacteraceae bacterium KSS8]
MAQFIRSGAALAVALLCGTALSGAARPAQAAPAPTLMRYPNTQGGRIVFVADGNLWTVPYAGGTATRLTADDGQDLLPRFSPDGKWIAYTATDQGNQDVYVIPSTGGEAKRLTFHSDVVAKAPTRWGPNNMVVTWTPDSKNVVFLSRAESWNPSVQELFTVPVTGGLPQRLPINRAGFLTYGPDGKSIAYSSIFRDFRTWKRYDGGRASDIYTYDFSGNAPMRITDWKGTDTQPMWVGRRIYFLSDRDKNRRANIWRYDLDTKQFTEITHFGDYDVDFPSYGDNAISFQQGGKLWRIDLPSEQLHQVEVSVPDDGTRIQPRWVKVGDQIRAEDTAQDVDYALSPNGERAAFSARGDIVTVPAEHGAIRNITRTSDADEDHPSWSPDGTEIAYTTDGSGNQQVAVRPAEGGPERLLTRFPTGFFYTPVWSPDGRLLAVPDANHNLWLVPAAGGEARLVAKDAVAEIHDATFSPDSKWLSFSTTRDHGRRELHLFEIAASQDRVISRPENSDHDPAFTPDGKYLAFISERHELPAFSDSEFNIATVKSSGIYLATLQADTPSPFAPRSDEGAVAASSSGDAGPGKKAADGSAGHGDARTGSRDPNAGVLHIDFDGLIERAVPLPIPPAHIDAMDVRGNTVFYQTSAIPLIEGQMPGEKAELHAYDLTARKDEKIVDGLSSYVLSRDGKRVLFKQDKSWHIADAKPGHGDDKTLPTSEMRSRIDPREEWAEMFNNAWRLERDLFYNASMNGDDWNKVRERYSKLLPLLGSRADLTWLIGEVQGELGNSHTYSNNGDDNDKTEQVPTPLLGVDYALDSATGRYRFARIYPGDNSRKAYRSPLTEPGVNVHAGDYLLAVNGVELKAPTDPYSLFVGLTGPITITVAHSTTGPRRDVMVNPIPNELAVREQYWISHNREKVNQLSGGRVGYIYLSDMESLGMEQFIRQFYSQLDKQALLIDDRYNNGGFIDQIVLERLRRVLVGMTTNREGVASTTPQEVLDGPKAVLMNHYSASDGDIFPYYFRKYGLGKLIGTRSWGGVRGIRGNWGLLDGGSITVSEDSLYGLDGKWVIENHGVDPDVEVEDTPSEFLTDHDIQLETGVRLLVDQLDKTPHKTVLPPPAMPAYPADGIVPPMH